MRIVFIDIDSLRPDHLGCYGYSRDTSPNIDLIASDGVRFEGVYASDAPCLPSRTAMWAGRFGLHTGVSDHVGTTADPFPEGRNRKWNSVFSETSWMSALRRAGYRTVSVSSFGGRHSAFHWYAGYSEIHDTGSVGQGGLETGKDTTAAAIEWLDKNGAEDNWFLHVNYWDVHWPYRVPTAFGEPFRDTPHPSWLTPDILQRHRAAYGVKSARDFAYRVRSQWEGTYPRQPVEMRDMQDVRKMFDGYDTSISYVDHQVGLILDRLKEIGVFEDTAIIVGSDHGEHLGELNMYMSHRIADNIVTRLAMIIRWPGTSPGVVDASLHYHFDIAATVIELVRGEIPSSWDGESFAESLSERLPSGRPYIVTTAGAGGLSRGVRFGRHMMTRMYDDGYNNLDECLLFDLESDPHQLNNLISDREDLLGEAVVLLDRWYGHEMSKSSVGIDPLWVTVAEGGAQDMRGQVDSYMEHLKRTGRERHIREIEARA